MATGVKRSCFLVALAFVFCFVACSNSESYSDARTVDVPVTAGPDLEWTWVHHNSEHLRITGRTNYEKGDFVILSWSSSAITVGFMGTAVEASVWTGDTVYLDDTAYKIGKEINVKVNDHKLKVVGYYIDPKDSDYLLVSANTMRYKAITENKNMTVCPVNKQESLHRFKEEGVNVYDVYQRNHDKYMKEQRGSMTSMLVMAGVILAISFIEIFLMIRASFLSRIKEVGVYRAIGVKKRDIYKMFCGEIIAITTIASLPGMLFMSLIISRVVKMSAFENMFMINPGVCLVCLIVIYGLNLIFGLLPVWRTIRKTPAAILARTDVN